MNEQELFLFPIKIEIEMYDEIFGGDSFIKCGEELFDILNQSRQKPKPLLYRNNEGISHFEYNYPFDIFEPFSENKYIELLGISDIASAKEYFKKHPNYRFYFSNNCDSLNLISQDKYLAEMVKKIQEIKKLIELHNLLQEYDDDIAQTKQPEKLIEFYLANLKWLYSTCYDNITFAESLACECDSISVTNEDYIACIRSTINEKIAENTESKKIVLSLCPPATSYRCQDLISSMYIFFHFSNFNKDTYKQCSHPRCSCYYKIDKRYQQSRCDKHMEARRKKRKSAAEKEKLQDIILDS